VRKYITPAAGRCNKDFQSEQQLLEEAEKASSLSAAKRSWADRRWHRKMYETPSKQPPNVWHHRDRAHRQYYRDADPFLVSETYLTDRYGLSDTDEFEDWRKRVGFPEPYKVGSWRPGPVLDWERERRRAPPKVDVPARIERPLLLPNGHGGNTSSFRDDRCDALHPRTEKAARTAERRRKQAKPPKLTPSEWDRCAKRAKGGNERALKILWEAALPFAVALAAPFCARNTSLSAEHLASEALYPISKTTGNPNFGLRESLAAWDPGGGRAFVWYLRALIEGNIRKSLRGNRPALPLDEAAVTYYAGDGIFDGDGFDFDAALAAFDEREADLTDTERHVIARRRAGATDQNIADGLRVSRERARQIRFSALNKLRG